MIVGILKEIKADDNRVAMSPGGVEVMRQNGHSMLVEKNAGRVGLDFLNLPLVIQFNKRDLKDIVSEKDVNSRWEATDLPLVFSSAIYNRGVRETFSKALKSMFQSLNSRYGLIQEYGLTLDQFISVIPPAT